MYILLSIVIVSFVIGRVNLIENIVFKSYGDGKHYDPLNMAIFFLIGFIKVFLALFVTTYILPSSEVLEASQSIETDPVMFRLSLIMYNATFRTALVSVIVVLAEALAIWRVKN